MCFPRSCCDSLTPDASLVAGPFSLCMVAWCLNDDPVSCIRVYCITVPCMEGLKDLSSLNWSEREPTTIIDVLIVFACFCAVFSRLTGRSGQARDGKRSRDGNVAPEEIEVLQTAEAASPARTANALAASTSSAKTTSAFAYGCRRPLAASVAAALLIACVLHVRRACISASSAIDRIEARMVADRDVSASRMLEPSVHPVLMPIISMQRSGSTELSRDLAKSVPAGYRLSDLDEIFNPGTPSNREGTAQRSEQLADPVRFLKRRLPANTSGVYKIGTESLPSTQLRAMLREPSACPIVIERGNLSARFCSLVFAKETRDWSGHVATDGVRERPPCTPELVSGGTRQPVLAALGHKAPPRGGVHGDATIVSVAAYGAKQEAWYEGTIAMLRREQVPFLYVTFDALTRHRSHTFATIYRHCGFDSEVSE